MMKFIPAIALLFLLRVFSVNAQLPHWQSLGFRLDKYPMSFYVDTSERALYMTGVFEKVDSTPATIVRWDGQSVSLPYPAIQGATAQPITKFQNSMYLGLGTAMYRFQGTSWSRVDSPKSRWIGCFYHYGNELIVPSGIPIPPNKYKTSIGFWDGNVWTDKYDIDTLLNGEFWMIVSVAEYKGELYFGGNINPSGKPEISEIVRFDGKNWKNVGGGIKSGSLASVGQLLVWKGDLYVSGVFSEKEGGPGNCIARWDGRQWHRLGGGVTQPGLASIERMAVWRDKLYVAGAFDEVDGIPVRNSMACWDGSKWCTVGDTMENVGILGVLNDELYIGGAFRSINGDSSYCRIAKWTGGDYTEACAEPTAVSSVFGSSCEVYPNPVLNGRLTVSLSRMSTGGEVEISIRNVTGQRVFMQNAPTSGNDFRRELNIGDQPPGLYFVEIKVENERLVRKVVID